MEPRPLPQPSFGQSTRARSLALASAERLRHLSAIGRLLRVSRLIRLIRTMPELTIMVHALVAALRSPYAAGAAEWTPKP